MADRSRDKLTREDFASPRATPPRRGGLRRMLSLFLVLALVLGVVLITAYWDLSNADSLRRLLTYSKTSQETAESTALYTYDNDRTNLYARLDDKLVVVSSTRVSVLGEGDEVVYSASVTLEHPALVAAGEVAAVYDVGGTTLYVLGEKGLVRDMSEVGDNGIVDVSLNASGYMTVVTEKSGYKSALSVYAPSLDPVFVYNSSEQYIVSAGCERDCKHVVFATIGENNGSFSSTLQRYALDGKARLSASTLDDALVLRLGSVGGATAALADDRFAVLAGDGSLSGAYLYDYPYLRGYTLGGDDFAALVLSRYRSGSTGKLVTVGTEGTALATLETQRDILAIDACGRYLAVLYADRLVIYTSDLTEYATLTDTQYAKSVLMRKDGSALLLGSTQARLFIP